MRSAKLPMAASARSSVRRPSLTGGPGSYASVSSHTDACASSDPLGIADQAVRHLGIERVPGALADEPHDALVAAEHALEGRIDREGDDPHRQRDLLFARPSGPCPSQRSSR